MLESLGQILVFSRPTWHVDRGLRAENLVNYSRHHSPRWPEGLPPADLHGYRHPIKHPLLVPQLIASTHVKFKDTKVQRRPDRSMEQLAQSASLVSRGSHEPGRESHGPDRGSYGPARQGIS
jgi:hypothetical protein